MPEQDRRWTTEEISNYISKFTEVERDNVIRELMGAKILSNYLNMPEGKLILNSVIDSIRDYTMKIIRLSVDGFDKNKEEIKQAALQVNVAYDFIYGIATILTRGEEHEESMKRS